MLIEFEHTVVKNARTTVLHGLDLTLSESRIAVVGPNGAGKSTFARLLNGLVLPSEGRVRVGGIDTRDDVRAVRRRVGFVFQNPENQIVFPIVSEDMAFGLKHRVPDKAERRVRIAAQLDALGIGHLADRASHLLSGGERQLAALAAVLVTHPDLVVFDEPTTQLDLRNRNRVRDAIAAMDRQAVVVSHDLDLLVDFDRVLVVVDGRIAVDDTPAPALRWYREHCG